MATSLRNCILWLKVWYSEPFSKQAHYQTFFHISILNSIIFLVNMLYINSLFICINGKINNSCKKTGFLNKKETMRNTGHEI